MPTRMGAALVASLVAPAAASSAPPRTRVALEPRQTAVLREGWARVVPQEASSLASLTFALKPAEGAREAVQQALYKAADPSRASYGEWLGWDAIKKVRWL